MKFAVVFVLLHTAAGTAIHINPDEVVILRPAEKGDPGDPLFTDKVACVVGTEDGKFVTVVEPCDEVEKLLEHPK